MRRVLVVSYYFPPAGGSGVQRVLKAVKYLPESGWAPTVLTVRAGAFPEHDASLAADVPAGVAVHRTASMDPYAVYAALGRRSRTAAAGGALADAPAGVGERLARWVRANAFIPDARVGWVPFAVRAGRRLIRQARAAGQPFDAVLTSGPPHSTHLVGRALRREGTPWVADFRDPWTDLRAYAQLPLTATARRLNARLERRVLEEADRVVSVGPTLSRHLAEKVERSDDAFAVVYNGFDADDFDADDFSAPSVARHEAFELTYVGTLYSSPNALWRALASLRARGLAERLRVRLVGPPHPAVAPALARFGLEDVVVQEAYVPHAAAVVAMRRATALLLTVEESWPRAEAILTGKLFEYLAAGRPVLGVGPPAGDAAAVLRAAGAGPMFSASDPAAVASWLGDAYARWDAGEALGGAPATAAARYSRRAQTAHLAHVLDQAAGLPR